MSAVPISPAPSVAVAGPNILLEGPSGTGKTYALGTLCDWAAANGKEVNLLFVENSLDVFLGYWKDRGLEVPPNVHWHQQFTAPLSIEQLVSAADLVGKMSYKMITEMQDGNRSGENNAFWKILQTVADFKDDRTGQSRGGLKTWGMDQIFAIDSLTEVAVAAMKMQIGNKPTGSPSDYGVAQNMLMNFLRLMTQGFRPIFAMTAHIDRIVDEVSQTSRIMTKAIGRAIAGDIPPLFSDVIYTVREGDQFYWDTAAYGVDTKTRSLGYRSKLKPDFATILDVWKKRGGQ